ncbi:hypothetical protein FVE85_9220 [Porphyridium purpureum]|uniref:Uncharacterized protein n=1 Tax=Porphyridium purpureum TaxID=35688 RepID=A0A5J4YNS5_PORPP|nr:hypothetical protein FVE85_9220 [Porphyridium purpureum]|eukprot:POR0661..scf222_8
MCKVFWIARHVSSAQDASHFTNVNAAISAVPCAHCLSSFVAFEDVSSCSVQQRTGAVAAMESLSEATELGHGFLDTEGSILSTASFNGEPTRSKQSARLTETPGLSRRNLQRYFASDWVIELILYDTIDMDTGKADFAAQCRHIEMLVDTDVGGHTSPTYSSTSFSVR